MGGPPPCPPPSSDAPEQTYIENINQIITPPPFLDGIGYKGVRGSQDTKYS